MSPAEGREGPAGAEPTRTYTPRPAKACQGLPGPAGQVKKTESEKNLKTKKTKKTEKTENRKNRNRLKAQTKNKK